jgi:thiamine-phosphate pyrophosphorylase
MSTQLYLVAPPDAETEALAHELREIFGVAAVAALLLPRGHRPDSAYRTLAAEIIAVGQAADCAVLVEGSPEEVRALGADGVHVGGPLPAVRAAIAALKPELIVGTGGVTSRHDAMTIGELAPDYIMFGPLSGATAPEIRDLAGWWAETMEIPSVFSDPAATPETADALGCEFLALSESIWQAASPAAAVAAIADRLGATL